ncbi:MAG TPA: MaoC family dehydratase [Stellaceae bacterium]|jgi:3-hydroxybutyryl-CoA dehydratase|nr:MaoC family dehydratase [Stellaceae bacterium]
MDEVRQSVAPRQGYALEELVVGMTASYFHTLTEANVVEFADLTGDHNPLHLDEEFAKRTRFKGRIVHGMLTASFLSTVVAIMPGPGTIYLSQSLAFHAPVRIGDTVEAHVTVAEIIAAHKRVRLKTVCRVGDTVVLDGEALVLVPTRKLPA